MKNRISSKSRSFLTVSAALAYAAFHGVSFAATFVGETIGINFVGRDGGGTFGIDSTAGVLVQQDWNMIDYGGNGGTNNVLVTTNNLLYDDATTGTSGTSSVSIGVQAADSWKSYSGTGTPDATLLNGIIKANGGNRTPTFNFSGLSSGSYRVIVYTTENGGGGKYSMSLGGTTYYQEAQNGSSYGGSFVQGTNTTNGTYPVANYVDFATVTTLNGVLSLGVNYFAGGGQGSDGIGIAGFQLQMLSAITAWSGTVDGNWDTTTANWSGGIFTSGNPGLFLDLDTNSVAPVTRTITVDAGGVTVNTITVNNSTGDYTFSGGTIGGTGGLVKSGTSALTFNSTTTYTGGTTVNGGTMNLGHATDTLADAEAVTVGGGTLAIAANSDTVGAVTLTSGNITGSSGVLTGSSYDVRSGSVSAILGGAGSLTKTTNGTVILTGLNTYSGATNINGGVLQANDGVGLPSGLVTMNGGVLATGADFVRAVGTGVGEVQLTGGSSGFGANGAPVIVSLGGLGTPTALTWGDATFNPSTLVLNPSTADNSLEFRNALNLNGVNRTVNVAATGAGTAATLSGVISSVAGSLTKTGNGTLVLSGANTYGGGTTVSAGTIRLGSANSIISGSDLSLGTGGTLDLGGFNQTVGVLTSTGTVTNSAAATNSTLTVASGSVSSPGTIVNGAGTVGVVKNTGGTLTVNAANTYSGGTNVTGGTLSLQNNAAAGTGTVTLQTGTTLEFGGFQTAGLNEGLLTGSFNTSGSNPNEYIRNTTRLANANGNGSSWPTGIPNDRTVIYTGFINNTGAAASWTFGENYDDSVLLKVNGSTVLNNGSWNTPTHGTAAIASGLNSFELRLGQGGGGWGANNASWWQNGLGIGIDYTGQTGVAAQVSGNYSALPIDSGNGLTWITGAPTAATNIANAVTLNGNATIRIGYSFAAASAGARMGSLAMGGHTLQLTGSPTASSISSGSTTVSTGANFNVDSNVTFNPGALDDSALAAAVTKSGTGLMRVDTTATSVVAGSSIDVTGGILAFGGTAPFGTGSVTLQAGTTLQLEGGTRSPGLLGQFYSQTPTNNAGSNPNFATLTALNAHLAGLTPAVTTLTTTGGKLSFDFSNNPNNRDGAPFNGVDPTQASYGFANPNDYEVRWTGFINVTNPGIATFSTGSDDGSMVFINDENTPVVNNNFFQGFPSTKTGTYNFTTAGYHKITLAHYEGGGGAGALFQWNQAGDALHTLLNTEVLSPVGLQQTYANNVNIAGNSTIAVSLSLQASIGNLSIGTNTLSVTSPEASLSAYSLNATSTTLTGNATFNVANSTGGGAGTLALGPVGETGGARSITKTGNGTLKLAAAGTFTGGTTIDAGTVLVTDNAGLGTGVVTLNGNGSVLTLGVAGTVTPFAQDFGTTTVNGSATLPSGTQLRLTSNSGSQAGSGFHNTPLAVDQVFNVDFTYTASGDRSADGAAFIIQNAAGGVNALGGSGGSVGYGGITPSAAVILNIFGTEGTAFKTNGATGGYTPSGAVDLSSGNPIHITLSYDPLLQTLSQTLTDTTTLATYSNTFTGVNLASIVGGNTAYFGFSGATGGQVATQDITGFLVSSLGNSGGTFANNVVVTGGVSSTIQVSGAGSLGSASMGALTLNSGSTLNVAATGLSANTAYTLTMGGTTLAGDASVNVAKNGTGDGVLKLGIVSESGGSRSLTKGGNGTLRLDQANTYTGGTNVNAGTVLIANTTGSATGSGLVTLQTTGKLAGTGTVGGNVSVQSGGIFAPGTGVGTTLNIGGNVTIVSGGLLNYTLAGNGVSETAGITGTMNLSGNETLNLTEATGFAVGNTYTLATALGGITNTATFAYNRSGPLLSLPGVSLNVTVVGNDLVLGVTSQSIIWTGLADDQWDNSTVNNWTTVNPLTDPFIDGYSVTFDDTGIAQNVVTISSVVKPNGTAFSNTAGTYVIDGVLGGPGGVTKTNAGQVNLQGVNAYTGATKVLGGTVNIEADNNLGAAPAAVTANHLVVNGGTLYVSANATINANRGMSIGVNVATVDVDSGFTATYGGVIANVTAETGELVKTGGGTLTLSGISTFTGDVTINGGTLRLNGSGQPNGTLAGVSSITINSGATLLGGNTDVLGHGGQQAAKALLINEGGTLNVVANERLSVDFAVTSIGGTIAAQGSGQGGNGNYTLRNSNGASYNFTSTTPTVVGAGNGTASTISAINVGLNNTATFNVTAGGGAGAGLVDLDFTGTLIDAFGTGSFTKSGNGKAVLAGINTYSGVTTLDDGILNVATFSNYGVAGGLGNRGADSGGNVGILFQGGTLQYTGATAQTTDRAIRISTNGGATIDASGSIPAATLSFTAASSPDFFENAGNRTLEFTGSNTGDNTFAMAIEEIGGTTSVEKTGTGKWVLSGAQNYSLLTTSGGVTDVTGSFTSGTATVNANATTNFGSSQKLFALNIGTNPLAFTGGQNGGAVVPEPGSAVLLMGGLLTMLGLRRRRA